MRSASPAPWHVVYQDPIYAVWCSPDPDTGECIVAECGYEENGIADAVLIASAPDMLEALRLFVVARTSPELTAALAAAEAAIERACSEVLEPAVDGVSP